jgi:peptide deformylase
MERAVILVPDTRLKQPCPRVEQFDEKLKALVQDLEDTMAVAPGCVGIAAPQVGEIVRVAIVDTSLHRKHGPLSQGRFVLVNPEIIASHGERTGREGCLSLPDFTANVRRALHVTVRYQDVEGNTHEVNAEDFEAVAFQHEIDHLDGILFLDRVSNLQTDVFPRKK